MRSFKTHVLFLSLILLALPWSSKVKAQDPSFLTNGLIAYFPFSGNAKDESGHGFDGKVSGAILAKDRFGKPDSAYSFHPRGSFIRIDGIDTSKFRDDFAISLWSRLDSVDSTADGIFVGQATFFGMAYLDANRIQFGLLRQAGTPNWIWIYESKRPIGIGVYHHFVVSRLNSIVELWIDGELDVSASVNNEDPGAGSYVTIGGTPPENRLTDTMDGEIDDVRIYSRGLSGGEIRSLYKLEREVQRPRRAKATGGLVNGFLVEVKVIDPGAGYTNAPKVTISGGGGTGATAFSTINNGSVDRIFILNSGSGFTSPPTIAIEPPSSPPSLSISVATVSVTMSLVEGRKYQLESSKDFQTWQVAGPAFIADTPELTKCFEVAETGQYFRLREVQ